MLSVTKGSSNHIKHIMSIQPFIMGVDWPEIGHLMVWWMHIQLILLDVAEVVIAWKVRCSYRQPATIIVTIDSFLQVTGFDL